MHLRKLTALLLALTLASCNENRPTQEPKPVERAPQTVNGEDGGTPTLEQAKRAHIAYVDGRPITLGQLHAALAESHAVETLIFLAQARVIDKRLESKGEKLTDADVQAERNATLEKLFKQGMADLYDRLEAAENGQGRKGETPADVKMLIRQQHERLLPQFLASNRLSMTEFNLSRRVEAGLRKLLTEDVSARITEKNLKQAFNLMYGEKVSIRHIQLNNTQEVAEAKKRLKQGHSFERVAREMSRSRSASMGGQLPPFSRNEPGLPDSFKDVAFATKEGEISDPVQAWDKFHLIRVEKRIEPQAVKFADVKNDVRKVLESRLMQQEIVRLRAETSLEAVQSLDITDPDLRKRYMELRDRAQAANKRSK